MVVLFYIFHTLLFQQRYPLWMKDEFFQFSVDPLVAGLYVDDGTKLGFMKNLVVFRFSTSYADDPPCHRFSGFMEGV